MDTVSVDAFSSLDIVLPLSFLKESLLAHECEHSDVIQWIAKGGSFDNDTLTTNIATHSNSQNEGDGRKNILISVKSVKFNVKEGKIICNFSEITRSSDSAVQEVALNIPEKKTKAEKCTSTHDEVVASEPAYTNSIDTIPTTSSDFTDTPSPVKRKRGRPRKDVTNKENKDKVAKKYSISPSLAAVSNVPDCGRRYGLRGVKLSSVIMRAEKGIGDNVEEKIYLTSSIKTEIKTEIDSEETLASDSVSAISEEEAIVEPTNNNNVDEEQSKDCVDHDCSDSEWTQKRKPGRPRKKFKVDLPRKVRKVIDLGDNIPIYKRRQRNNVLSESCKYCAKKFCDYTGVDCHVRRWHKKEKDVDEYLDKLKELKMVTCRICNTSCQDRIQLQIHENRFHFRNETVKCKVCNKMYKNVQSLRNHMLAVHGVKGQPHLCHHCPAKFKWAMTLKQHIEEIHEGKMNIICKVCNKKFARKSQLTRHERIHGSDESKSLVCPTCGKGFWYECNYQRHMRIVHGPVRENFHCSYCGKGFNLKSAMVSHVQKVHLNIYPFRCPQCKMGMGRRKLLEEHMAQAHNMSDIQVLGAQRGRFKYGRNSEDLFYCSHCSLSFCYKTKMVEHMHIDHGTEFPFMCKHCCQGFLEKHFLVNHLKKAHNSTQEEEVLAASITSQSEEKEEGSRLVTDIKNNATTDLQVDSIEVSESGVINAGDTLAEAASVLLEVASGNNTIHYVQLQEDGGTAVVSQELSSLLLAAEQSLQLSEAGEVELSTSDGQTLTYIPQGVNIGVGDLQTVSSNIVIDNVHMETEVCSNDVEISSDNIQFSSMDVDIPSNNVEISSSAEDC
ncbi:zinc finger and BTB domain-containing protein 41-like [Mizuhopecten yessoensis]|uniref:Zinc finger protein 358 n=1 Tax=Mizuhopecten yessoensis TaxID=6573 RepID=A0A210R196_MIZYE|nr:zinc finger and BTB domain-containing protein 41-like [Mizuhopecten yessoensis]OWF54823.1 Zinc finger protein 358 [Mizuhopecten yessoensis]